TRGRSCRCRRLREPPRTASQTPPRVDPLELRDAECGVRNAERDYGITGTRNTKGRLADDATLYSFVRIPYSAFRVPHCQRYFGSGVGVWPPRNEAQFFSVAARMSRADAPERYICSALRVMSRHTAHSVPCGSHSITSPFSARVLTKQSSFPLCPMCSQPQKHGT